MSLYVPAKHRLGPQKRTRPIAFLYIWLRKGGYAEPDVEGNRGVALSAGVLSLSKERL